MDMNNLASNTRAQQVTYWVGALCLAIGSGSLRECVNNMIDYYQREAFERGVASAKAGKS